MNCLPTFSNLYLSTDFVHNYGFFLPLKIQHNAPSFSSTPYLRLRKKRYSVASKSSTSLRRTTNYQPSLWDDSQIQSLNTITFTGYVHEKRREKLKEDVKRLIKEKSFADQLELFDSLQKLGVAYHFEKEIKYLLNLMKYSEEKLRMEFTKDLHAMALYFRLSRGHGFEISKDLLVKSYKDEKGYFKPFVFHDIKGLLSLYEASFLSMDGEDEIDEAKEFALKLLNDCMRSNSSTNPVLAKHIALALELPLHHRIQKLQAPMFIENACNMKELDVDPILLEFAQLDFNMTQSIYNRELKEITRWWTKISNLAGGEFSFAREWPVESYFLAVGLAMEPRFSTCRKEFAKAICFINVVDDIYDIYGSLDELQHFIDAVERWDLATSKSLPEYMKICLSELFNTVNSLACKIMEEKGLDILPYLKRAWLDLCKAYMVEARWYYTGYCPTFAEYLDNAWISVAAPLAWWTKISYLAGGELSFARESPMESYFLAVGLAMKPRFSTCRKEYAKVICFINVVDDIYDIYGSLEELQHFTHAVERSYFATSKSLPEYMKICLSKLFNTVNSLACKIMEEKGLDILPYVKREGEHRRGDVSKSIQCYMKEKHVSELEAHKCIRNIINKCCKELNREWIKASRYEETFKMVAINLSRVAHLFYLQSNDENVGELNLEKMNENVISLFLEPITLKE
ncbi:hypothetical protein M5K25_004240 [Dendrobium thyrsiflorum]|uniref:Uncharacterized protein n=1 Tax=Dendrobium thyrsiflorum TaxID=117978 RepID=A0ABD0VTN7_DENTH